MRRDRHLVISSFIALTLIVTACGSGSQVSTHPTKGGSVTIDNEYGSLWSCGFNPFNASANLLSFGIIYETLYYDNLLTDQKTPMLASSYQWSADNKTLTFTIRSGVQWSDGQPFSAADVVYTFNLIKQTSALDIQSVWSVLSSVTAQGSDQVVMTFAQSAVPYFYMIAGQVAVVPQHVWQGIKDPVAAPISQPVGTGPFTLKECTPQNVSYARNANYWQKGLPYLDTVNYPAFTDNDPANAFLAAGQAQWGGQFIPNIDTYYVAKDRAHNHYWFPPINNVDLWFNVTKPPFDNKVVRQAFAYGIDRGKVSKIGEYGYEPAGNQTGVITPTMSSWLDTGQVAKYDYKYDPAKVSSLLQSAGYSKNSKGIFQDASGKALSFTIINIGGFTDWVAALQVVQDNLKQAGIEVKIQNLSADLYYSDLFGGKFDLAYGGLQTTSGPSPYYELRNTVHSATTAPIGQTAGGDYGRYKNPAVDALFDQFGATTDAAKQHDLMKQIEAVMLEDVPVVPVTEGVAWYQYSTKNLAGWPTQSNPYAAPAPWNLPDWEITLLHLYKAS